MAIGLFPLNGCEEDDPTDKDIPPGKPTNVQAPESSIKSTQVTITWKAPRNTGKTKDRKTAAIVAYIITCALKDGSITVVTADSSPYTLTGLTPNTQHTIKVKAKNSADLTGEASEAVTLRTLPPYPIPGNPTNLQAPEADVTATRIKISWEPPSETGMETDGTAATITGYEVTCTSGDSSNTITVGGNDNTFILTGLSPDTEYTITVKAKNSAGKLSTTGAILTQRTKPNKPSKAVNSVTLTPTILNLTVGGTDTLTVTITPTDATNRAVRWASDDPDIATVNDGVVTAVAPGTTTIIVTSISNPEKIATAQVIVRPTVTFVIDGGTSPGTLNTNGTVQRPTALEKPANTFAGWFVSDDFSCTDENIFDFDSVITQDMMIYGFRYTENPADKAALQDLVDAAVQANPTAHLNYINTAAITQMDSLFHDKSTFNGDISCWNVTNVKGMSWMFAAAGAFNQPLGKWDVANVDNMAGMFAATRVFNQDISRWNVANVNDMSWMFSATGAFNQPLSEWNVANVNNMAGMFNRAEVFDQHINNWTVDSVSDMSAMFAAARVFNHPLNGWNVDNVTNMMWMFRQAKAFDQPLDSWNVENVFDMSSMFNKAEAFNQNINDWNVKNVIMMYYMFREAKAFNQPLNKWKVNSVTDMGEMFRDATVFNQDISSWNVDSVIIMTGMFRDAEAFNQPLNGWKVNSVNSMKEMFRGARAFNRPLNNWNVAKVTDMSYMFHEAKAFGYRLQDWGEHLRDDVITTDMFFGTKTAKDNNLPTWYRP